MHVERFAVYFAVGIAVSVLLVPLFGRLDDLRSHARPARGTAR